jgi:2-dehydro-3-deoxy-D-arabinonate dehydratase
MTHPQIVRVYHPELGNRIGCLIGEEIWDLHPYYTSVHEWIKSTNGRLKQAVDYLNSLPHKGKSTFPASMFENAPDPKTPHWLAPVDEQEVWAAGVTYERSRDARQEESADGGDVYARVYAAERPEIFFKSPGPKVVGHLHEVGIREDATWNVPEPELGLVINSSREVIGFTIGNDMSSRDIEGANPLYLPQAKVYTAACSMGPGLMIMPVDGWLKTTIKINITRGGKSAFDGEVHTGKIHRSVNDLVDYLTRSNFYPDGVVLLTGTGTVPPNDFTLAAGDVITITIDGLGVLKNTVKVV